MDIKYNKCYIVERVFQESQTEQIFIMSPLPYKKILVEFYNLSKALYNRDIQREIRYQIIMRAHEIGNHIS